MSRLDEIRERHQSVDPENYSQKSRDIDDLLSLIDRQQRVVEAMPGLMEWLEERIIHAGSQSRFEAFMEVWNWFADLEVLNDLS